MTGEYVVLEPRYVGQQWERTGTVHLELCESKPSPLPWGEREVGAWVESHATYELVSAAPSTRQNCRSVRGSMGVQLPIGHV